MYHVTVLASFGTNGTAALPDNEFWSFKTGPEVSCGGVHLGRAELEAFPSVAEEDDMSERVWAIDRGGRMRI